MAYYDKTYMIIPDSEITTEMVNWSTSSSKEKMPLKGGMRLVEANTIPPNSVFQAYQWYDQMGIADAWAAVEE